MSNSIILQFTTSIIAIISLIATFYIDKLNTKVLKSTLVIISIILISISVYLSIQDQAKASNIHQNEVDTTLNKLNTTINKSDALLDSLRMIKATVKLISDSTEEELRNQRVISSLTQSILFKNKKLLGSQVEIYKNTNRELHPLFPITLTISFLIPFSSSGIKPLVDYLYQLKDGIKLNPNIVFNYYSTFNSKDTTKYAYISSFPYEFIQNPELSFNKILYPTFDISLFKGFMQDVRAHTTSVPQMHFTISDSTNRNVAIKANFKDKVIEFAVTYHNYQYQATEYEKSNTFFGSNELMNTYIVVSMSTHDEAVLKTLKFYPLNGHLEKLFIRFLPSDTVIKWRTPNYFHKIVSRNFEYWDEDEK